MKRLIRILVTILLAVFILASIGWYLFDYDRDFTRDMLLREARLNDMRGNSTVSAWFYKLAYSHSNNDEDVAIELANQYKSDGNFTKAEVTLSKAINAAPSARLYTALCETYVQQDKLMDAINLLSGISDGGIRQQIDAQRPIAPTSPQAPGFYSQYTNVELTSTGKILYTTNGEYPSIRSTPYTDPIKLGAGETILYCISVGDDGLVSPLSVLGYTVGGVVEPAVFMDAEMEFAIRDVLGMNYEEMLYTNDLWEIKEFTVPAQVRTLEDLAMLPHLESLCINNLQLSTLGDLVHLPELQTLDLSGCRFNTSELTVLQKLPELRKLILSDCGISTIADLTGVNTLTYLDISNNTVRNLDPIVAMENMQELYMQHNAVISLEAVSGMYSLAKMDVSFNAISTLAPLNTCTRLSWLNASNNQLTSVTGISALPLLTTLALDYNQLADISPMGACVQLVELSVNNNRLSDISMLASLRNLEVFDFSYNSITALPGWPEGGALRVIQGSYNKLTSINALSSMSSLTYVSMDYNSITDISALANCNNLVQVNVYGNAVSDVSALTAHNIIVNYDPT